MPADRKYNRSRSPGDDRTNRRKQETSDRDRHTSVTSSRYRDRSRERRSHGGRRDDRRDDRRYRDSDRDQSHFDNRYRRGDSRTSRSHRDEVDSKLDRHDRDSRDVLKHDERSAIKQHDPDYGRLKSPTTAGLVASSQERSPAHDDNSRKRKVEHLEDTSSSNRDTGRKPSRFDRRTDQQAHPGADSSNRDARDAGRPNITAHEEPQNSVSTESIANLASPLNPEDEKLRLRQERLAQWKKKKAEEEARRRLSGDTTSASISEKETSKGITILGSFEGQVSTTSHDSQDQASSRLIGTGNLTLGSSGGSMKPSVGISKFGMTAKTNSSIANLPNHKNGLNFDEEVNKPRSLPHTQVDPSRPIPETYTEKEADKADSGTMKGEIESDDIDPLDAFMAHNSSALHAQSTKSRSANDILNDQESDLEADNSGEEDALAAVAKKVAQKKKDLPKIDHSRQDYEEFRKDFYVEPEEMANMTEEDVDAMRLELDGIVIRGKDCPKPVMNWGQCGLSAATLEQIQRLGYESPTSIQAQAIPAIMSGRDTIGVAKTGSGKTVAFLLPMFRHIKDQRPLAAMEGPIAIVMTPTRELAVQIHKECKPFLKALNLRAICVYGGNPIKDQIAECKRGAEVVVCTPGRMIDILVANQGRVTNLRRVTYTVLDEADRMFDLGFEPQVMAILNNIRPQRQTVLFSATFPLKIEAIAKKLLRGRPVTVTVGARSVVAREITQIIEVRPADPDSQKFNRVLEILGQLYSEDEDARTLIFVDRQEAADSLLSQLMRKGYPCNALHGGKDQYDRDSTISDFKAGIFPIMVATSVAARGLDVKQLKLVINYDCPNHMEDYVHRVGRTGRAGNTGTAVTFVGEDQERYAYDIAKALRLSQADIPEALKKLADSFSTKLKSGQEKRGDSGFGGRGLAKFDTSRDKEMKLQRKTYGEDDDADDAGVKARLATPLDDDEVSVDEDRVNPEEVKAIAEHGTSTSTDAPIKVERVTAQSKKAPVSKPNVGTKALDPVAAARARAAGINTSIKAGVKPIEQMASNPDAGEYRALIEVNDVPQKARWNVTNRTNIAKVLEATGTSITTQGQYIKPGSTAPPGVPKLYLLVEGPTELCVTDAVKELRRLIEEGTQAEADAGSTRYKVV